MKDHITMTGQVLIVGAGPGDPELLTVRAHRIISRADVIVHDRLVSPEILQLAPDYARRIDVGKMPRRHPVPQERINQMLVELALAGDTVVRLKGGDPFIFGRGGEEMEAVRAAGIPFDVVPGITAAQAASASACVPLTQRGMVTGLRYVTGHCRSDAPLDLDWAGLADPDTTLVIYMGAANMAEIAAKLIAQGMPRDLPVMAVASAATPREKRLISRLGSIPSDLDAAGLSAPVLFIVGHVVDLYRPEAVASITEAARRRQLGAVHA